MEIQKLKKFYTQYKETSLYGRYIFLDHIAPLLEKLENNISIKKIGSSENNQPINLLTLGTGPKKLLFWSQMHGNESTTTKAIFDSINFFNDASNESATNILQTCTLYMVPILNPDGAKAYTRLNYNQVDLNRDAQDLTQKESKLLLSLVEKIQPDFAFNLHGQRTIFSAGATNHPATISFLSPAGDPERSITPCRKKAMEVIVEMNKMLQHYIPDNVGRYDDSFNLNCVGDALSDKGIPTILFEAGHYPEDYQREQVRSYIFYSLIKSIHYISENESIGGHYKNYFEIPENQTWFYDIIIRRVTLNDEIVDIAIQYKEELFNKSIKFVPIIAEIKNLEKFYGHIEIIGNNRSIRDENDTVQVLTGHKMLNFYLNNELFSTELIKN